MSFSAHVGSPCTPRTYKPPNPDIVEPIFEIENISIERPPLLKIFYWESFDIEKCVNFSFNKALASETKNIEHHMELPTSQLNSKPLKIVFWLRNLSNSEYSMRLKRIQNCQCKQKETRVGFNQFRNLYHCPHRRLINITQELFIMRPGELLAMSVVAHYYLLGSYKLSYELSVSDSRIIMLHFHLNMTTFDPDKSVLNTNLIPVNIKEHRRMAQPLWIRNVTIQSIRFSFAVKSRDLRLINPNILVPPQSVWPLIVEYRPSDLENNLDLFVRYGENASSKCKNKNCVKIPLACKGCVQDEIENYSVPVLDYECADYLYVIYPNRLEFVAEINEERTLMVAIHNYNQKCMEFKWQNYTINDYFSFTFEPLMFSLKPHHSKLCVVQVKSFNIPLHFKRIPAVLEIHRTLDKSTQIAKQLLTEIESIDDPKWARSSYVQHVLLHLDLKVNFPKLQRINVKDQIKESDISTKAKITDMPRNRTTIFEKLYWEYLSKSNYMRDTSKIPTNLTYKQVLNQETNSKKKESCKIMDKQVAFNTLSFLIAEACHDLSKNHRFVPKEISDINLKFTP